MTAPDSKPWLRRMALPIAGLALAIGWTGAWFAAAQATDTALQSWFAREREQGRDWACNERAVAGFPFGIRISCREPRLTMRLDGQPAGGTARKLVASAHVLSPRTIRGRIDGPLALRSQGGERELEANWTALFVDFHAGSDGIDRLDLRGEALSATVRWQGYPARRLDVAKFENVISPAPDAPARGTFDIALDATGISSSVLDLLAGNTEPASLMLRARASGVDLKARGRFIDRLERWRLADGALDISRLHATKGSIGIDGSGTLSLDAARRPVGRIDGRVAGLDSLMQRFGLPAGTMAIEGMLKGILAGRNGQPSQTGDDKPRGLPVALSFRNGRVAFGPLRLPFVLPPLY